MRVHRFLLGATLLASTLPLNAKPQPKRLSVLDYYYLLPHLGIGDLATRQEKQETLAYNHPVIDLKHDYMDFQPDSSPREQLAIFRARGQADIVADSSPDYHSDYNNFGLYRLEQGKLKNVTRRMLPEIAWADDLLCELPRIGTTIRVYRFNLEKQSRHHAFDLQWRGGHFVKVP